MKKIFLILSFILIILSSCDRSGVFEEFVSATPYEFHVIAVSDAADVHLKPISGVTVQLFRTEAQRTAGTPIYASMVTGSDGAAVFTESILNPNKNIDEAKGFYYLKLTKDGYKTSYATSRYLLINDGHTHQWVQMLP